MLCFVKWVIKTHKRRNKEIPKKWDTNKKWNTVVCVAWWWECVSSDLLKVYQAVLYAAGNVLDAMLYWWTKQSCFSHEHLGRFICMYVEIPKKKIRNSGYLLELKTEN